MAMQSIPSLCLESTSPLSHNILLCLEDNISRFPLAFEILAAHIGSLFYEDAKNVQLECQVLEDILSNHFVSDDKLSKPTNHPTLDNINNFENSKQQSFMLENLKLTGFQQDLYTKALREIYHALEYQKITPQESSYFQDSTNTTIVKYAFACSKSRYEELSKIHSDKNSCLCLKVLKAIDCNPASMDIDSKLGKAIKKLTRKIEDLKCTLLWKISFLQWLLVSSSPSPKPPTLASVLEFHHLLNQKAEMDIPKLTHSSASSKRSSLLSPITRASSSTSSTPSVTTIYDDDIATLEEIVDHINKPRIKQVDSKIFSTHA
ncbi:hypothetical protein HMI54_005128 [Coelomomyces lativittatus]|nr:hypothetical protein HMI56_002437 [Coelomomyces lativittatus]KAJ1506349.1 hypothetical protein HMI54_005128 [Coelomomyces lativittatus]KAJ1509288.1 hypothetical protein HMI55_000032 [Coelomomyces lativittatus]